MFPNTPAGSFFRRNFQTAALISTILVLGASPLYGVEYFVAKGGRDDANGLTEGEAFATIQKGVSVLSPGDTLTIGPGEYAESVRRNDLGAVDKTTIIQARIPGTVLLRGDTPVGPFRKTEGYRRVYEADESRALRSVAEADSWTPLRMRPNLSELDITPGSWFHDAEKKKLYIVPTDSQGAEAHTYRGTVVAGDGLFLSGARNVVIRGLAATGFNDRDDVPPGQYRTNGMGHWTVWGIFLYNARNCVIEDCTAYLNGGGIGVNNTQSKDNRGGDNRIVRCTTYGNFSQPGGYQSSGIGVYNTNGDEIRDCLSYKNNAMGIRTYLQMIRPGRIIGSTAWNNLITGLPSDIHLKDQIGPNGELTSVETSVATAGLKAHNVERSVVPKKYAKDVLKPESVAFLPAGGSMERNEDFADATNLDFRLQADSTLRGAGPGGNDLGTTPFQGDVFYVRTDGSDEADGLSVKSAWKSLQRAFRDLKAGQTLYIEPGIYDEKLSVEVNGTKGAPIVVRGRGAGAVILNGAVAIKDASHLKFERLHFSKGVLLEKSEEVSLHNCQFLGGPVGLAAKDVQDLRVTHGLFSGFSEAAIALEGAKNSGLFLSGNLYDNKQGVAVSLGAEGAVAYSDYNAYRNAASAWRIAEAMQSLADWQKKQDQYSQEIIPELAITDGTARVQNALAFATAGPLGNPVGNFRDEPRQTETGISESPLVHSVSKTTANLEWKTTQPLICKIAWGETPQCANTATFESGIFGTYSLNGLKPGKTYYFRIKSIQIPPVFTEGEETEEVALDTPPVSFTTLAENAAPATYYVAPEGSNANSGKERGQAWQTITHAAGQVNVGDTVLIASGTYSERVIMRATGEADAPITFKALPGERVQMVGANKKLSNAIVATAKQYLRFDGFYFSDYSFSPSQGWLPGLASEFSLYKCKDIEISRCFSDGRGGVSARSINAFDVKDLLIKNLVSTNKMSGALYLNRCDNLRLENSVIARPLTASILIGNLPSQSASVRDSIFTDSLEKKAKINAQLFDFAKKTIHENNCYFLRYGTDVRQLSRGKKLADLTDSIRNPFIGDPQFAGVATLPPPPSPTASTFPADRLMDPRAKLDFDSFFATQPEVVERKIGLQPEAFRDYSFNH